MKLGACLVEQLLGTASVKLRAFQYEIECVFGRAIAEYWILLVLN